MQPEQDSYGEIRSLLGNYERETELEFPDGKLKIINYNLGFPTISQIVLSFTTEDTHEGYVLGDRSRWGLELLAVRVPNLTLLPSGVNIPAEIAGFNNHGSKIDPDLRERVAAEVARMVKTRTGAI